MLSRTYTVVVATNYCEKFETQDVTIEHDTDLDPNLLWEKIEKLLGFEEWTMETIVALVPADGKREDIVTGYGLSVCEECEALRVVVGSDSTPGFTGAGIYVTHYLCGHIDVDDSGDNMDDEYFEIEQSRRSAFARTWE